ncbi:MAG: 50S ribosomal protein L13 [Candidatus Kerfeldbacteria bacterium RIFCSPLOWO2_01_FULL_48_11]|uniref:50S ribosomal protein L13 n=2 Tax=Parcubacteria group TaxID=1794811 RepID=A0A1G1Y941_9BACT|nr:MAG: 50S ribosomal protein L13 [Parcubacteria group bacterium GW2011_GWA2_48_9]KKW16324.1 MAG: 50S ribosomal protein L13 [Parcubacteria group bacterium GW2011_GWC2_49_9]OGY48240.1 MAG: 50S ribosomal protein L13 [Candidatus Buchananbacteria bacterium RIFCSPHIGHO2_01_FULL_47_11b]OGY82766.1 MAG: 50S ribosomal protein L13 [Candidatus Kerfeldbacteria bacterium RIFCSPLOWO2_01_FULL_48_11]HCJ52181.1 50S ribosomal protein L13 [Candidatus Kerfeldbacteria bacterium]
MNGKQPTKIDITVEARGKSLGRLASEVAHLLQGKHLASYRPNKPALAYVLVTHLSEVKLDPVSKDGKVYYRSSLRPGGLKKRSFNEWFQKDPQEVTRHMVYGMLPKNKLRKILIKHLTFI